jgi:recombination protein RecA
MRAALLKAQIEQTLPAAFTVYRRQNEDRGSLPTGIAQIDSAVCGVPLHALTEICGGSNLASSGKTSILVSLLAQATRDHFCALVDAGDNFDPASGQAAGISMPRLLWVRCGKSRVKLPPLEQAFKVADILLQSGGFTLIAVDLSGIPERVVRKVPLSSWFRFSRVIERQPAALVFLTQEPHATSCASLVLRVTTAVPDGVGDRGHQQSRFSRDGGCDCSALLSGNLLTQWNLSVEVVRDREKKPARSERTGFSLQTQWA